MSERRVSHGSMSLSLGADARIGCLTYTDDGVHPILTIDVPNVSLTLSPVGYDSPITDDHVTKARALARAVAVYLAEVKRLRTKTSKADAPEAA